MNSQETDDFGYIYLRNHSSYDEYNAYKMGKASNIPERDTQYATSEIERGHFEAVFKVNFKEMGNVERLLQNEFIELNIRYNAGTEFYNRIIINLIEPFLDKQNIECKKLSKEEISELVRSNRVREIKKIDTQPQKQDIRINKQIIKYKPREYQTKIIEKSNEYFKHSNKGMLVLMCGVGKTLISLWITQILNSDKILIGVPNILLLNQWEKEINNLFQNIRCLIVSGNVNKEQIIEFLKNNQKKCKVITTYSSAYKI